jgi:hypothetical protein
VTTKYTNKALPHDPSLFPPPATWLSWTRNTTYQARFDAQGNPVMHTVTYGKGDQARDYERPVYDHPQLDDGKIRHYYSRAEARKSLLWLGKDSKDRPEEQRGTFYCDWAVYEFVDGEWVLRGSGLQGEPRKTNSFFAQRQTKAERVHPFDSALEAAAIESILKVAS